MSSRLHHISVFVRDMERAVKLFHGLLGLEIVNRLQEVKGKKISGLLGIPEFVGEMVFLKSPGDAISLELIHQVHPPVADEPGTANGNPGIGISLLVHDLDGLVAELTDEGWPPVSRPIEMPDPSGNMVRLVCFWCEGGLMVELIERRDP